MNTVSDFFRTAIAAAVGLMLMLAGTVFAASLFLAVLLVVAFNSVAALLTGRKPAPLVLWERWRDIRSRSSFGAGTGRFGTARHGSARAKPAEVVDVEVREVEESPKADDSSPRREPNDRS
ncbi:MAG: hypothetical protein ABI589_06925 [Burkholderiales bacterium]